MCYTLKKYGVIQMGFFSKFAKAMLVAAVSSNADKKKSNPSSQTKSGEVTWEAYNDRETGYPQSFERNNREWLDAERTWASPSGEFFVHEGYFYGKDDDDAKTCIALTTKTEGLKRKTIEDSVDAACVSDEGVAYALTDSGTLHRLTKDGTSSKHLMDEYYGFAMTNKVCVLIDDDGDNINLVAVNLITDATLKKQFAHEDNIELENGSLLEPSVVIEGDNIIVTIPDDTKQVIKFP